jgi:hypothetical protein
VIVREWPPFLAARPKRQVRCRFPVSLCALRPAQDNGCATSTPTRDPAVMALAGPANRQARVAADAICGREAAYGGVYGTGITQVFGLTVASTGVSWKRLPPEIQAEATQIWFHPKDHVWRFVDTR